ncbi:glycosyltransferase [Mangrovibacterium diazotrophicum]|uniref:Putative rhamnosyltransferase n=1 Tax=Mangrovibacterium diazotrophicum TaxID=1261403 RepID=A0A419WAZ3_9BACT|nr:glycosyltransferase [Mangrovibacterium diazotrophicum]RKD92582.1 putative rhamnosyltransferase [Mangrovibacterium diazotrophicum]
MFAHFVITQFNLKRFPLSMQSEHKWTNWTRERVKLFQEYCLPSFMNQTTKNFKWLIYFDVDTPSEFNPFLERLKQLDFIHVYKADGHEEFISRYRRDLKELAKEKEWIIETRCDNDDCLHQDAIATIQRLFKPQNQFMISLASGYTLNTQNNKLSHYFYPGSPFMSIVEQTNRELTGIFKKEHSHWDGLQFGLVKELSHKNKLAAFALEKPYWIQVIHQQNVRNSFHRGLPVLRPQNLNQFGLQITSTKQALTSLPKYTNYVIWKRYLKCTIVRLFSN